jgi:uncharacterized hydrophobic protein (TIGR00271 family)
MTQDRTIIGELRYSRDMRLLRATTLGLGLILSVSIFLLVGPIVQRTGERAPWAYLAAGALFLPTALSLAELVAAAGPGAFRKLIEASNHQLSGYLTGWTLIGGGIAVGALLVRGSGEYLSSLVAELFGLNLDSRWLGIAILLLLTGNSLLGSRESRWRENAIVIAALTTLLFLSGWAWLGAPSSSPATGQTFRLSTTAAVSLLGGALWGLVLILVASEEMRWVKKDAPRALIASLLLGCISGALVSVAVHHSLALATVQSAPLAALAARLGGAIAQAWLLTIGVIILAASLNYALLTLARLGVEMSREGYLPQSWRATHPQFRTPNLLLAGGAILVALASVFGEPLLLAALSALSPLIAAILLNIPALLSHADRLPRKRPIALPFSPLIPGMAIAINFFLVTALPVLALLIGAAWLLAGGLIYVFYSRRGVVAAQTGVTVFREEPETRAEASYRVLVPVANPATADALIGAGGALARAHEGEILVLQVVVVPEQTSLLSGRRTARQRRSLLDQAVDRAEAAGVPVHSIVRIAHSPVEAILDTANEENCDLILMGWRGEPNGQSYDLGPVIDPVVTQASCDVAVLKGQIPEPLECILVPTAGGPHAPLALQIGLDLAADPEAEVIAMNMVRGPVTADARREAQSNIDQTLEGIEDVTRVSPRIVSVDDVKQGILEEAARCDLLMLGASEEGVLDQITFGGLPEDIARTSTRPVILVKRYRGLSQFWLRQAWRSLYSLFPQLDRAEQVEVYRNMRRGARPDVDFFVLIFLASVIATLGLLQNSAAVIIGAMLVAPLMTPVLAISLGIVLGDVRLLRLSLESTLKGITLAVAVAVLVVLLVPRSQMTTEMMARTNPTLLDLIVAMASGAAGAYAIARKDVAAALPGVAIAAALVPPLGVLGAGIALARPEVAGGALLLFVTNLIAISVAGAIVFLLLGFHTFPDERERRRHFRQALAVSLVLVLVVSIPLAFFLVKTVRDGQRQQTVTQILTREAEALGATLVDAPVERQAKGFHVVATLYAPQTPDRSTVRRIQDELSRAVRAPVSLEIVVVPVARVPAE